MVSQGLLVTPLGLLALILCAQQTGKKTMPNKTKPRNFRVCLWRYKYPNRGRKQVSNCIRDQAALKTSDQMSEMHISSLGTGLFNPTFRVQQLQVFSSLIGNNKKKIWHFSIREASPSYPSAKGKGELGSMPWSVTASLGDLWAHTALRCPM